MEKKLTDKQTKIVTILKESDKPMTLAEIGAILGEVVKSGTTNTLVKRKIIQIVGERTIICPTCGAKHKVKEYTAEQRYFFSSSKQ